jgi:hypothetical protein
VSVGLLSVNTIDAQSCSVFPLDLGEGGLEMKLGFKLRIVIGTDLWIALSVTLDIS